jgi:2-polyprenyl-6-methoxyphenol hydroxylase-like FAD-dependent oxidoreductase
MIQIDAIVRPKILARNCLVKNGPLESDVLIVGAGPVGLALANELAFRGVNYLVVDEGEGEVIFPAAEGMFSRTMEHLRRWGIANRVRRHREFPDTFPLNVGFCATFDSFLISKFDGPSNADIPRLESTISPEGRCFSPKRIFDKVMRECVIERGGRILNRARASIVEERPDGVLVHANDIVSGQTQQIRAKYVVGCDGARSTIRKLIGAEFSGAFGQGRNFAAYFRAPRLLEILVSHFGSPFAQVHSINLPGRPYITAVDGRELWRFSMYSEQEEADAISILRKVLPFPIDIELIRAQPWYGHEVVAERYQRGRVFLAGDAAHLRWPKGGFGANTGIGDAVDLGWKLAGTLEGWGGPNLLRSYSLERRPVALRNTAEAADNWKRDKLLQPDPDLEKSGPTGDRARARMADLISEARRREYATQGIQLGYRYATSPIVVPDGTPAPPDTAETYRPSTWPGSRAPHAWLAPGISMLDRFGAGWVLVDCSGRSTESSIEKALRSHAVPPAVLKIDNPDIATLYERQLVLVRPDGHTAWRADTDPTSADEIVASVTGH